MPLLSKAIEKLEGAGLKILAGIADGLSAMKKTLRRLELKFPEFCGFVDYDHSFKNLRNAWCLPFSFGRNVALYFPA